MSDIANWKMTSDYSGFSPLNMVFFQNFQSYVSLPEGTIIVGLVGPQAASPVQPGQGALFFSEDVHGFPM